MKKEKSSYLTVKKYNKNKAQESDRAISEVAKEAREKGLSYGKLQAQRYLKNDR